MTAFDPKKEREDLNQSRWEAIRSLDQALTAHTVYWIFFAYLKGSWHMADQLHTINKKEFDEMLLDRKNNPLSEEEVEDAKIAFRYISGFGGGFKVDKALVEAVRVQDAEELAQWKEQSGFRSWRQESGATTPIENQPCIQHKKQADSKPTYIKIRSK